MIKAQRPEITEGWKAGMAENNKQNGELQRQVVSNLFVYGSNKSRDSIRMVNKGVSGHFKTALLKITSNWDTGIQWQGHEQFKLIEY